MFQVDVTWLGYFMALVSLYYVVLFLLSMRSVMRRVPPDGAHPPFVLIMPAHNEELVIGGTLETLAALDYEHYAVIVVNDGSSDDTARRARAFESTGRVRVIDRPAELSGQGKGAVLNDGFRFLGQLLQDGDPIVSGFDP